MSHVLFIEADGLCLQFRCHLYLLIRVTITRMKHLSVHDLPSQISPTISFSIPINSCSRRTEHKVSSLAQFSRCHLSCRRDWSGHHIGRTTMPSGA
ncbi:hypothetical protein A4A49_25806 [Nicotiana attenuata]|uniref:Uncharacterized protein n=1 Tax=Nicotiana attenuata TaxID=49451 RepID=A0A1J6IPP0_NICAT|nr:hypothetical protein A4A49_25806 [Nicotiana attenuata]